MSSLTVVVPTFNEADNIATLVDELGGELRGIDAEILFVDDSTDHTPDTIRDVAGTAALPVRMLHREVPEGRLAGAVVAGLEAAQSPWVVVMDGDLQHPPAAVPALYRQALLGGGDVVVASRYLAGGSAGGLENGFRRLVSTWSGRSAKTLFPRRLAGCTDPMSGFFAVRRDALRLDTVTQCGYKVLLALLLHRPLSVSEVPFTFAERKAGESKASMREGLRYLRLLALLRTGPGLLFALVGASGVIPNLLTVALLGILGVHFLLAAAVATQVAIAWNFAGAELIVFRDRRVGRLWHRAVRYVALSETDLLRLPFVAVLVNYIGLSSIIATAVTLVAAVALRYSLAARLVYGADPAIVTTPTLAAVPAPRAASRPAAHLPSPPTDEERDSYLGNQHRWLSPATFVGYLLIVVSVAFLVGAHLWALFLIVPLAFSTLSTTLALVTTMRRSRVSLRGHRSLVEGWRPARFPSVDVFLPSAGEDLAVIDNTFQHVQALRWQGDVQVYVLDDSARPEVAALAQDWGFHYLSRPDRGHFKKAGNLRYGFEHSEGDLIAIFDADFVPRPDFLYELSPYFDEPTTAIVQSPQYFDVLPGMNWLQRAAGSTQVLFYRYVQPSRDASGAAICVGTSAMYRRSALQQSGGFAQIGHSEDVHTGVNLMAVGYQTRYVPTLVSKGACPDSFNQFVSQQYRWCNGSMSLLFSRRFHRLDMTFMQKLCYWSGFLFYISTALDVLTTALPPLLMAYFAASQVAVQNYVFVLLALVVRQALIPFITSDGDSLVNLARIQTTYSFAHLVQIWDLARGREDGWVATGATGSSVTARRIITVARAWLIGTQLLLWSAIAWRTPEYGFGHYWPMMAFALFNLYIVYPIVTASEHLPVVMTVARRVTETGRVRPRAAA